MKTSFATLLGLAVAATLAAGPSPRALACGGGLVTINSGTVAADAQRIFLAVRESTTEVVTQIAVPQTSQDYGVLIPLPANPTLDPNPVPSDELDELNRATLPRIIHGSHSSGGPSCGCGSAVGGDRGGDPVQVSPPVAIGPVVAVVITAATGVAINKWLGDNGFVIPQAHQALVSSYSGVGRYFIAVRRNDKTTGATPSSIGIHFTLPGDQRGLPLRFARLGAAGQVAFTVFDAAAAAVAPAAPFSALTLKDLDGSELLQSYTTAVAGAVKRKGSAAFLLEGAYAVESLPVLTTGRLAALVKPGQRLTRLSTVIDSAALTTDVALTAPPPPEIPSTITIGAAASDGGSGPWSHLIELLLIAAGTVAAFALLDRGRPRRRAKALA